MSNHDTEKMCGMDIFKWLSVLALLVGAFAANQMYGHLALPLRLSGWLFVVLVTAFVALQTARGRRFSKFAKEARNELRKVVWPTRQETVQTTIIVVVIVLLTSLLLWGMDTVLLAAVGWLTGQRG